MNKFFLLLILLNFTGCLLGGPYRHKAGPGCNENRTRESWRLFHYLFGSSNGSYLPGVSDYFNREMDVEAAASDGNKLIRMDFAWKTVEPTLDERFNSLTLEMFWENRDYWIELYRQQRDWSFFAQKISWAEKHNLSVLALLGHGYRFYHPLLGEHQLSPDRLGKENYLARQVLFTSAFLRQFKNHSVIKMVQIENELNVARLTTLWGWRAPIGLAGFKQSAWGDWKFQTRLIEQLSKAVKMENSKLLVTHNFSVDVHDRIQNKVGQPGLGESIELWRDSLDVIGFDSYPNYYDSQKNGIKELAKNLKTVRRFSCQKPIMILETNYPSGPEELGFTREKQKSYLSELHLLAMREKLAGVMIYGAYNGRHRVPPNHEIATKDRQSIRKLGEKFHEGRFYSLLAWLLFNQKYAQGPLLKVLQSVEYYWSLEEVLIE